MHNSEEKTDGVTLGKTQESLLTWYIIVEALIWYFSWEDQNRFIYGVGLRSSKVLRGHNLKGY